MLDCIDIKKTASYIDHTALKSDLTTKNIEQLCKEAKYYSFATVCINPFYVSTAKKLLINSNVKICTVIGFPLGMTLTKVKEFEAYQAIMSGADEIDMVMNIGALKEGNLKNVEKDIKAVCNVCNGKALLKIIIETGLLDNNQKKAACSLIVSTGADYIKTSTGFSISGARVSDVELIKSVVGKSTGIKASGGIKDLNFMKELIKAGATRIGTSSSISIMKELN